MTARGLVRVSLLEARLSRQAVRHLALVRRWLRQVPTRPGQLRLQVLQKVWFGPAA